MPKVSIPSVKDLAQKATGSGNIPWDENEQNAFWKPQKIDGYRWDKLYPYRLLVVAPNANGTYYVVKGPKGTKGQTNLDVNELPQGVIAIPEDTDSWVYNFPISFQQLSIVDQYAINSVATLRGVSEEHNGVKFKMISANGTTGIFPSRVQISGSPSRPGIAGTIFSGTLEQVSNFKNGLSQISKSASGKHPASVGENNQKDLTLSKAQLKTTGYYKIFQLGQFLERYAEAKKLPANKNWHLAIDMPKQNQTFLVTPVQFSLLQNANKPMEYNYGFQLKAFKRIEVGVSNPFLSKKTLSLTKNDYLNAVNTLKQTRKLMSTAANIVKAVRSDFIGVMDNLRQITLLIKDISGVALSIAELPSQLVKDLKETLADMGDDLKQAGANFSQAAKFGGLFGSSSGSGSSVGFKASLGGLTATQAKTNGSNAAKASMETDPVNNVFNNPHENFEIFDAVSTEDLKVSIQQQQVIDEEIRTVNQWTTDDLRTIKNTLLDVATDLVTSFGAGDISFAKTYNKATPTTRDVPMSLEENELIASIFDTIQELDAITSNQTFDDDKRQNSMEYIGELTSDVGITFDETENKKRVPVPFGLTIEEIALRYLGDSKKWLEISMLNNLQSPYIDEVGYSLTLLSNGSGRQFTVNDSENKLWIGQTIYLNSNTVPVFTRKITSIDGVSSSNKLITVDGLANLDSLKTIEGAKLQGYLSSTINSQNLMWIPSNEPTTEDSRANVIPFLPKDDLRQLSKIDFLLTEDGDLAISSSGDFRLANGMTNLIQAIRLKLSTEKGRLLNHDDYGIDVFVGKSLADVNVQKVYDSISASIGSDERFSGIRNLQVVLNGPTIEISLEVIVINSDLIIPVSFSV